MLKIPTECGIATVRGDKRVGRECHMADIRQGTGAKSMEVLEVKDDGQASAVEDPRDSKQSYEKPRPGDSLEAITLSPRYPERQCS